MNRDWIKKMKETERLKLSFWQTVNHYFIVVYILLIPIFTLISVFEIYVTKTYDGVRSAEELLRFSLPWIIPAIAFLFIQKYRLRFKKVTIDYTDEEFKEAVERTVKELEWTIDKNNKTYLRAYRQWNWTGSWGEMITIIRLKNGFLTNSICDPDKWSSVASFGWNRKNIRTFVKNLNDVKNDIPIQVIEEKQENEWTLKRIGIRFLMYPLSAIIITAGLIAIYSSTIRGMIAGIAVISFVSIWIYADVKLIMKQKNARKHNTRYSQWRGK
jgi:hypothetical protein